MTSCIELRENDTTAVVSFGVKWWSCFSWSVPPIYLGFVENFCKNWSWIAIWNRQFWLGGPFSSSGQFSGPYGHLGYLLCLWYIVRVHCIVLRGLCMYLVVWCSVWSPSGCCCVRALSVTVCSPRERGGCMALSKCSNCFPKGVYEIALQSG